MLWQKFERSYEVQWLLTEHHSSSLPWYRFRGIEAEALNPDVNVTQSASASMCSFVEAKARFLCRVSQHATGL